MRKAEQSAEFYRQIGENIRISRKERHLSQDTLAKLIGLTRTSLTNIESGRQHPSLYILCNLAEQLQVRYDQLLPCRVVKVQIPLDALASTQVRDKEEMAFIKKAIGIKARDTHGNQTTKNPHDC